MVSLAETNLVGGDHLASAPTGSTFHQDCRPVSFVRRPAHASILQRRVRACAQAAGMPLQYRPARTALALAVGALLLMAPAACGNPSGPPAAATTPAATSATVVLPGAGKNLVVNGDAEAAPGTDGSSVAPDVPGWTRTGDFTAIAYDTRNSGNFPTPSDPGPPDRGRNFFGGGPRAELSGAVQTIDVSDAGPILDGGRVSYTLSAWLGGFRGQDDHVELTAQFLSASGGVLATAALPVVLDRDRGGRTALLSRSVSGSVPAGTRRIKVDMEMIRKAGTANDGYADDVSLTLGPAG